MLERIAERAGTVPYLGSALQLGPRRRAHARAPSTAGACWCPPATPAPALERFYRRAARAEIAPRLDRATCACGTATADLTIRAQRTRWASCSAGGRMSFNWRLLLAPERVLEYVVWHEVCHLEILDHSPRFWALFSGAGLPTARTATGYAATAQRSIL